MNLNFSSKNLLVYSCLDVDESEKTKETAVFILLKVLSGEK